MIENLLEIKLSERDNFLKIIETLSRIGIESSNKKLVQSCHILHKRGKYYICHYRELFKLDGYEREVTNDDIKRRNGIAKLLQQWNLCKIVDENIIEPSSLSRVKVIPFKEKNQWTLKQNYTIGKNKNN